MIITHERGRKLTGSSERGDFLITNSSGGYYCSLNSRYGGLFLKTGGRLLKIADEIKTEGRADELIVRDSCVEQRKGELAETASMQENALVYELNDCAQIDILLDVKEQYDNRQWGRNYDVSIEQNRVVVRFTKRHDPQDGEHDNAEEFTVYIAIEGSQLAHSERTAAWALRQYEFDRQRGSLPFERHLYHAVRLHAKRIAIAASQYREEAVRNAGNALRQEKQKKESHCGKSEKAIALQCALQSLKALTTKEGICAGLPWFFQNWTRDEAISLKSLDKEAARAIIIRQQKYIEADGRLPNKTAGGVSCADSIGWHFLRCRELRVGCRNALESSIKGIAENHMQDGLVTNNAKETWMDSIERSGARIEIQALHLAMLRIAHKLTRKAKYRQMENNLKKAVREKFWNGKYLKDGADDETIRPNIFIAAYAYPKLLSQKEWERCFETILPKLWLKWGGIATIDRNNKCFHDSHTGENPLSYHNGDSWYWLNNLAAIVMHRVNKRKFREYIQKILAASTREILWMGLIGHHGELSSAKQQTSEGCPCMAWSSALYAEMVRALRKLKTS